MIIKSGLSYFIFVEETSGLVIFPVEGPYALTSQFDGILDASQDLQNILVALVSSSDMAFNFGGVSIFQSILPDGSRMLVWQDRGQNYKINLDDSVRRIIIAELASLLGLSSEYI